MTLSHYWLVTGRMAVKGTSATPLLQDSFTRTENLVGSTPDVGNTYVGYSTLSTITANGSKAVHANDTAEFAAIVYADVGQSDFVATAIVNRGNDGGFPGIAFRMGAANGWFAFISSGQLIIRSITGTTATNRALETVSIDANTNYTLKVTCSGTSITAQVLSGETVLQTASATSSLYQANTGVGIYHSDFSGLQPTVDDLLVVAN